jgi:hypothetical protein
MLWPPSVIRSVEYIDIYPISTEVMPLLKDDTIKKTLNRFFG